MAETTTSTSKVDFHSRSRKVAEYKSSLNLPKTYKVMRPGNNLNQMKSIPKINPIIGKSSFINNRNSLDIKPVLDSYVEANSPKLYDQMPTNEVTPIAMDSKDCMNRSPAIKRSSPLLSIKQIETNDINDNKDINVKPCPTPTEKSEFCISPKFPVKKSKVSITGSHRGYVPNKIDVSFIIL